MGLLQGWFAGTDTPALEVLYLPTGLIVFFLTAFRILNVMGSSHAINPQMA